MEPGDIVEDAKQGEASQGDTDEVERLDNSAENQYLFPNLKNVFCIISNKKINTTLAQFKINEIENIAKYILEKTSTHFQMYKKQ